MSAESDWRRVRSVFEEVLGLGLAEREPALDRLCAENQGLRAEVESLLRAAEEAGGFLASDEPWADSAMFDAAMPDAIGAYRIVREIGRGGMGVVYLGERQDGDFAQRAAIKVVRAGAASDLVMRRFRAERRILAGLEHAGIARLYDGGLTTDGAPYLVMEYVEGEDLLAHCARREMGLQDRLGLFVRVCDAVSYAHRHLVVHRDLKPSNILVTPEGEPKLLDFGLAKLTKPWSDSGAPAATVTSLRWMTPEYASPEQVRGEAATTATDVYALGVVLYELLTGSKPYQPRSAANADLERAILEQEPPRLSTATGRGSAERRALRGDLDVICAKCLQKDGRRRYGGAAELADDLRRYLAGRPIAARPDSTAYRLRKFAARHVVAVAAGAAAAIVLVALVTSYTVRLRQERDRAHRESEKQRAIATFLGGVFRAADPVLAGGRAVTARDLLDEGARQATEIGGDPEVQAALLHEMAQAYFSLELYEQALALERRALAQREAVLDPGDPEIGRSAFLVGTALQRMKRHEDAAPFLERSLAIRESLDDQSLELSKSLLQVAANRASRGRPEEFLPLLERAIGIERASRPNGAYLASLYNDRGIYRALHGDRPASYADFRLSITTYERSREADSWGIARPLINLAELLVDDGEIDEADQLLARAQAVAERIFGVAGRPTAYILARRAGVNVSRGDLAMARHQIDGVLAHYLASSPADHPDLAYPYAVDGLLRIAEGDRRKGRERLLLGLGIAAKMGAAGEPFFVAAKAELGRIDGSTVAGPPH